MTDRTDLGSNAYSDDYPAFDSNAVCRQLNSLLRGEISAAETYRMAIEKAAGEAAPQSASAGLLQSIQEDHSRAAQSLRDRIREMAGEASDSSGAWGAWAKLATGMAGLLGEGAMFRALKEGEEFGLRDYEQAMDELDVTSVELIENQLIPAQQKHIEKLNSLIHSAPAA
jgi:hypothetical protein